MSLAKAEQTTGNVRVEAPSIAPALQAGVAAGGAGGVLVALWWMVTAAAGGYGLLFPWNVVGATFRGPEALVGGASIMFSGLAIHVLTSVVFGVLFAFIVSRATSTVACVLGGAIYGMAVLMLMTYVVLPFSNPVMRQRVILMPAAWFVTHLLYGVGVGFVPLIRRHLATGVGRRFVPRRPAAD